MNPRILTHATGLVVGLLLVACGGRNLSDPPHVNAAPVATAGASQSVTIPATVTLDGSASYDPDGDALTYAWTLASVPTGSASALTGPATANPTFVPDLPGTYVAQLVVSDGKLTCLAPATTTITVTGAPHVNAAPVATAGANQSVAIPALVTLDASASYDPDGDALTYAWTLASVPAGSACTLTDPTTVHPTFNPDLPGTYVAQLVVSDGLLTCATPATTTIGVSGTVSLLVNGSFEDGLTSWSQGPYAGNPAGTSGWNLANPAPGTETVTGTAGLAATDGTANAVGGLIQTAGGQSSSVLYQDVTIPAHATTLTFSVDVGVQYLNGKSTSNAAIFWGLYPTSAVPAYVDSRTLNLGTGLYEPLSSDTTLHVVAPVTVNATSVAGRTLRLAFINATNSIIGASLVTVDNVKLTAYLSY